MNNDKNTNTLIVDAPKTNKLKIWKNFTVIDLVCTIVFAILSFIIGWSIDFLPIIARAIIGILLFVILESLLIPVGNTDTRVYTKIFQSIRFLFSKRKYAFDPKAKEESSKVLVPYIKEYDEFTIQNNSFIGRNKSLVQVMKISGFDIRNSNLDEQNSAIYLLTEAFQLIDCEMKLIKIDNNLDLSANKTYLETQLEELQKRKDYTEQQIKTRSEILKQMIAVYKASDDETEPGLLNPNKSSKQFYLVMFSNKEKDLAFDRQTLEIKCKAAGLGFKRCTSYEIVNLLKNILDPVTKNISLEDFEQYKTNLDNILSYKEIEFFARNFKTAYDYVEAIDEDLNELQEQRKELSSIYQKHKTKSLAKQIKQLTSEISTLEDLYQNDKVYELDGEKYGEKQDNIYTNISVVREYPTYPERAWLFGIMDIEDTTVVVNISKTNEKTFEKQLNNAIQVIKTNIMSTSQKNQTSIAIQDENLEVYQNVVNAFARGKEKFKHINTFIITRATSEKELNARMRSNTKTFKENGMKIDTLTFYQYDGFEAIQLKPLDPLSLKFGKDTTATTLGEAFPFISTSVTDPDGIFLAENVLGEPVIVDFFKNLKRDNNGNPTDSTRKNANFLLFGTTGSGKSTALKNNIAQYLALGTKVLMMDPEREYKWLAKYFDGEWIDASNGNSGRINPLQPIAMFQDVDDLDKEKRSQETLIQTHIAFLDDWIKILYPNFEKDNYFSIIFADYLKKLYEKWVKKPKLKNKPINTWEVDEYPIFTDLIKLIKSVNKDKHRIVQGRNLTEELLFILESNFTGYGKYTNLYNGYSTVKTNGNPLVVFDLFTLKDTSSQVVLQAQMMLITAYMQNEIKNNFFNTKDKTIIAADEAHLLIDEQNPKALLFFFRTIKLIRKRHGGVWLATQNPEDFIGSPGIEKQTKAMINNMQYSWIGNLSSDNIEAVSQMYKAYDGLTENQREFIANSGQGQAVFITSGKERQNIQMQPIPLVLERGLV